MTTEQKAVRLARAIKWQRDNPYRVRLARRRYYILNKDRLAKYSADYQYFHKGQNAVRVRAFLAKYPWYNSWQMAKQRCLNPNNPRYHNYGGKGIKFDLTKADIAFLWTRDNAVAMVRPSIDRRDPEGNYSFDNCRFIEFNDNARKFNTSKHYAKLGGRS